MLDLNTIKPGYGLGDLSFGSTREECSLYLGEPDDKIIEQFEGEEYILWYYHEKAISLSFEASEDYRLGTIIVENDDARLNGEKLIGKSVAEVTTLLKEWGYYYLDEPGDEESIIIEVHAIECNFIFTNNVLDGIQWSYYWIDDDTPNWPDKGKVFH